MSIPIRFRQSLVLSTVPVSLLPGEPAVTITPGTALMFVGDAGGVPRPVAGFQLAVLRAGDTMTGPLILSGDPGVALGAAPRQYVDAQVATRLTQAQGDVRYLQLTGGTISGQLNGIAPVAAANLTRRDYVDTQVATRLTQAAADALYAPVVHTHVESQITNLNRLRLRGAWAAGSYVINDMVTHLGYTYIATANTAVAPPSAAWFLIGAAGAGTAIGDTAPVGPAPGDLWFKTSGTIGLFVWFTDINSSQWISVDQSSTYIANMVAKAGDTMTGPLVIDTVAGPSSIGIVSGQSYGLDQTGDVRMRYNSATTNIEFIRGGIVKQTLAMA